MDEMQVAVDIYFIHHNEKRPHQGRVMNGRTPLKAFKEGIPQPDPKGEKTTPPSPNTATAA
ncbi:hypothetical protein [Pararhodospirillum oryzae]|uniref:Uncharacterized protein n=1 Tax=Pararhodospirillum oryzae TaxID=478448 RepID=A0A512H7K1_9PROT|nr:hypothetical protein [Pararhodospirillum oryzae]GEO81426.1 hypothetical protein ROR02_15570 [Pararhodospirillum oryzae]